jgi:hypothetical protein
MSDLSKEINRIKNEIAAIDDSVRAALAVCMDDVVE